MLCRKRGELQVCFSTPGQHDIWEDFSSSSASCCLSISKYLPTFPFKTKSHIHTYPLHTAPLFISIAEYCPICSDLLAE